MGIKICPKCKGKVAESRNICIHCGYDFSKKLTKICPECEETIDVDLIECPICGHIFEDKQEESNVNSLTLENDNKVDFSKLPEINISQQENDSFQKDGNDNKVENKIDFSKLSEINMDLQGNNSSQKEENDNKVENKIDFSKLPEINMDSQENDSSSNDSNNSNTIDEYPFEAFGIRYHKTISIDQFKRTAYIELISDSETPSDILDTDFTVEETDFIVYKNIYYVKTTLNCSVGYDREEEYLAYEPVKKDGREIRDSNGAVVKQPVMKTRTVTDWRPFFTKSEGRYYGLWFSSSNEYPYKNPSYYMDNIHDISNEDVDAIDYVYPPSEEVFCTTKSEAVSDCEHDIDIPGQHHKDENYISEAELTNSIYTIGPGYLLGPYKMGYGFAYGKENVYLSRLAYSSDSDTATKLAEKKIESSKKKILILKILVGVSTVLDIALLFFKFHLAWILTVFLVVFDFIYEIKNIDKYVNTIKNYTDIKAKEKIRKADEKFKKENLPLLTDKEKEKIIENTKNQSDRLESKVKVSDYIKIFAFITIIIIIVSIVQMVKYIKELNRDPKYLYFDVTDIRIDSNDKCVLNYKIKSEKQEVYSVYIRTEVYKGSQSLCEFTTSFGKVDKNVESEFYVTLDDKTKSYLTQNNLSTLTLKYYVINVKYTNNTLKEYSGYASTNNLNKSCTTHIHSYSSAYKSDSTGHWYECTTCGAKLNFQSHVFGDWEVVKEATSTTTGLEERYCTNCNYKETNTIDKINHQHKYSTTWTSDSTGHWHVCETCGDKSSVIKHTFGDWEVVKEATSTSTGLKQRTCSVCGYLEESKIAMSDHQHSYVNGVCSICGEKADETVAFEIEILSSTTCKITKCNLDSSCNEIEIPSVINGYNVVEISKYLLEQYYYIEKLIIPFVGDKLENATNTGLGYLGISSSQLTTIVVTNAKSIGAYAFSGCSSLTSITIPDSVTSIGEYAFSDCSSLTSITIPDSVKSIGANIFSYCYSLNELTIPFVGDKLENATNTRLEYFNVSTNNSNLRTIVVTNAKSIGDSAFSGYSNLTSITISKSVTSIGASAFSGCSGLINILIPESVTSIGDSAFYNCSRLTSITLPEKLETIGSSAFEGCIKLYEVINLSELSLKKGSKLNGYVAYYALNLKTEGQSEIVNINNFQFYTLDGENYLINFNGSGNVVLPNSFNGEKYKIYINAFSGYKSITSITIPNSVTSIGAYAFSNCRSLTSITIPNSVTDIGEYAFSDCSSLTSIIIPNSVTSIGEYAFSDCSSLTSITIPNSVTSIGEYTFSYCSSLTSIIIPNSVTSIEYMAFYGCSKLNSFVLPESVKYIDRYALPSIVFYKGTLEQWNNYNYRGGNISIYFYSESQPSDTSHSYWYYDSKGNICEW